jgi:hypothetical protein
MAIWAKETLGIESALVTGAGRIASVPIEERD